MKNLLKNIWEAPASTLAGGIIGALGVVTVADVEMPAWAKVGLMALAAFLAVFDGPNKRTTE